MSCSRAPRRRIRNLSYQEMDERKNEYVQGQRLTWRRKPKGTIACRRSRKHRKMRTMAVLQDLRDMAKATLLEPQFPVMIYASLDYRISMAGPSDLSNTVFVGKGLPTDGRRLMNPLKGTKRVPKSPILFLMRKRGIAYRARALW
jgi:hypothetical protein